MKLQDQEERKLYKQLNWKRGKRNKKVRDRKTNKRSGEYWRFVDLLLKINNFIAKILKIDNLTHDELPESKEFNRNFQNGGFFFACNFVDGMYISVHKSKCFELNLAIRLFIVIVKEIKLFIFAILF
jgi:hypothetical protein